MELSHLRKDYSGSTLRKKALSLNPFEQFKIWLKEAEGEIEPNAMQLATTEGLTPSLRTVLLKEVTNEGFIFYTHTESRKGKELSQNPKCALLFLWKTLNRQVTIEGAAELLPKEKADLYFHSRPRLSQLGTKASIQDAPISSREALESAVHALYKQYEGKPIDPPEDWGGYLIRPSRFELWQGNKGRLHDRFEYLPDASGWQIQRLSP